MVAGIQTFNQSFVEIGVLFDSAFHITMTPAVEPIGEAFQPNQTHKASAHQSTSTHTIPLDCNIAITGSIATVIGILSIIAEIIAENHRIKIAVSKIFFCACWTILSTIKSKTHAASIHQTRTKSDAKNTNTDSSTFLNIDFGSLWGETHNNKLDAHSRATAEALKCNNSWTKNKTVTQDKTIRVFFNIIWFLIHLFASIFWSAFNHFCGLFNSFWYENLMKNNINTQEINTIGKLWKIKSLNQKFAAEPIKIFGGSQISVPTHAIFDKIASDIRIGIGLIFKILVIISVTGTTKIIVVTLSKNIDKTDVNQANETNKTQVFPWVFFAVLIAKYCKKPVFSNSATIIIIQSNNKIVLKSTEYKTSWGE